MKEEQKFEEKKAMLNNVRAQLRDIALGMIDRMNEHGCYQTYWMRVHRIPPVPLWTVDWFITPFIDRCLMRLDEYYLARRKRDADDSDIHSENRHARTIFQQRRAFCSPM